MPLRPALALLLTLLGLAGSVRAANDLTRVGVVFEHTGEAALTLTGSVELVDESGRAPVIHLVVAGDRTELVDVPAGSRWHLRANIPNWWLPEESVVADGAILTRRIWPAARLTGRMRGENDARPAALQAVVETTPLSSSRDLPRNAASRCALDDEGRFSCVVPAGALDLSFRADGFIPRYLWDVKLAPGDTADVGTLSLRRGASLSGWVATEDGKEKPKGATVRLMRPVAFGADGELAERLSRPAALAAVLPSGFFQISGIEPGSYELSVSHPDFAEARVHPVEVLPSAETALRRVIALRRPLNFRIVLQPAREPGGADWSVRVHRVSDLGSAVSAVPAFQGNSVEGLVVVERQAPGRFLVRVADAADQPWASHELVVTHDDAAPHRIDIDRVHVAGEIYRGEKPLSARLWFGGRRGAVRVETTSAADGTFEIDLPREGDWRIEAALEDGATTELHAHVKKHEEGETRLVLRLPDNRLEGIVLTPEGRPEPDANVMLTHERTTLVARSDEAGRFSFTGVPAGTVALHARGGARRQSAIEKVEIGTERRVGPLTLRLLATRGIEGRVLYLGRPVVGAVVLARLDRYGEISATTGVQGAFRLELPADVTAANVTVFPPGYALRVFEIAVDDRAVELNVSPDGGTLRLLAGRASAAATPPLIFQNGKALTMVDLLRWVHTQNAWSDTRERQDVPNVAAGSYRVCSRGQCRDVQLAPGGVAEIDTGL